MLLRQQNLDTEATIIQNSKLCGHFYKWPCTFLTRAITVTHHCILLYPSLWVLPIVVVVVVRVVVVVVVVVDGGVMLL